MVTITQLTVVKCGSMPGIVILLTYTRTGEGKKDLTTFILEKDQNQFQVGKPIHKNGMRASPTGELIFDNKSSKKSNRVWRRG